MFFVVSIKMGVPFLRILVYFTYRGTLSTVKQCMYTAALSDDGLYHIIS